MTMSPQTQACIELRVAELKLLAAFTSLAFAIHSEAVRRVELPPAPSIADHRFPSRRSGGAG
jgi:hypothetical protein